KYWSKIVSFFIYVFIFFLLTCIVFKLHCLHICAGCTRDSTWGVKHNRKVNFLTISYHKLVPHFHSHTGSCNLLCLTEFFLLELGSSVLAHFVLKERLEKLGVLGCVSCIVGSVVVVMHAPGEHMPNSVKEI
ncbi:hypothetical protein Zm00014a_026025, partial [Zea mays]